ncbi:uncharacterized protein LOC111134740 [Crassostrea virginica]
MSIEQTIAETVQKCVEMNKLLETTVDAKVVSSSVNLTKSINHTNYRTESQISLLNHSIGLLNEQVKHLQTEKSNLVGSIAETKNKLSSVASELQTKQSYLELDIASNISRITDNYISLLNLSEQTNIITLHIQDLTQNLSSVEKELDVQLNLCKTNFGQHVKNQTESFEHKLLEFNRTIEVKWSIFNETLFRKTRIVENDITSKNDQLSSRLDQFSGNINSMMQKLNTLESSNSGQNSRLSSIESRLSTVSSTLESSNSGQNNRLSSIESRLSTVSSTLSNLRSDFNSHIPRVIRLVNGGSTYGRVEIFNNGAWGTVCDDNWDNNDAIVVCRMLGLRGGTAKGSAYYGQGSGSIWLDDVNCSGSEQSIYSCTHPTIGAHNCNHGEDAGVICTSP